MANSDACIFGPGKRYCLICYPAVMALLLDDKWVRDCDMVSAQPLQANHVSTSYASHLVGFDGFKLLSLLSGIDAGEFLGSVSDYAPVVGPRPGNDLKVLVR